MDILTVIRRYGHTSYTLAKEMGIKQSTFSQMINGNPTVKTLRLIAEAAKCQVAEFFMDELPEDFDWSFIRGREADTNNTALAASSQQALRCPKCGASLAVRVEAEG